MTTTTTTKNPAAVALGSMRSAARAEASRRNGRKGGRPSLRRVVFITAAYKAAHGRNPRGAGPWRFVVLDTTTALDVAVFSFGGVFSMARRAARGHFGAIAGRGVVRVVVLPGAPTVVTNIETRAVLAAAYRPGYAGNFLTHAVRVVDGVEAAVLCRRVRLDHLADRMAVVPSARPTCPACRQRLAVLATAG